MMPLMMLIMNLLTILIVWAGAGYIDGGSMQVGDMMAFIQYAMMIIMSFLMLSMVSVMLQGLLWLPSVDDDADNRGIFKGP